MPKTEIDYSNTIFYKIHCKNPDVKDVYIGHTTNFVQRKSSHKRSCTHEKSANYNCKVYNVIREYGGWNNWKMEIIAFHECADHYTARKIEQQYFEEYRATLNSIEPLPKPKVMLPKNARIKPEKQILYCEKCDVYCQSKPAHDIHNKTNKHINNRTIRTAQMPQYATKFACEKCNYNTFRESQYNRHLLTAKHKNRTNITEPVTENANNFDCECGRKYNARNSLWYHKQKCTYTPENTIVYAPVEKQQHTTDQCSAELIVLVKELILQLTAKDKQLTELQNSIKEMIPRLVPQFTGPT
jgi:hypothetical protein